MGITRLYMRDVTSNRETDLGTYRSKDETFEEVRLQCGGILPSQDGLASHVSGFPWEHVKQAFHLQALVSGIPLHHFDPCSSVTHRVGGRDGLTSV